MPTTAFVPVETPVDPAFLKQALTWRDVYDCAGRHWADVNNLPSTALSMALSAASATHYRYAAYGDGVYDLWASATGWAFVGRVAAFHHLATPPAAVKPAEPAAAPAVADGGVSLYHVRRVQVVPADPAVGTPAALRVVAAAVVVGVDAAAAAHAALVSSATAFDRSGPVLLAVTTPFATGVPALGTRTAVCATVDTAGPVAWYSAEYQSGNWVLATARDLPAPATARWAW